MAAVFLVQNHGELGLHLLHTPTECIHFLSAVLQLNSLTKGRSGNEEEEEGEGEEEEENVNT